MTGPEPVLTMSDVTLWHADARTAWQWLPARSVDAIVTSPPYYGLRDYGVTGQLGLEATPTEYIDGLADLLTSWGTTVLKPQGSLWLNLGDTYAAARRGPDGSSSGLHGTTQQRVPGTAQSDVPPKCLLMIPERVALALVDRGWVLRNKIVWAKPNGMPSSVTDRLACKHEYLFHLVRQPRYHYDLDAIREPQATRGERHTGRSGGRDGWPSAWSVTHRTLHPVGANPGDVWSIPTTPYTGAHFAVFPPELIRRPILATVPTQVCRSCGRGRERITERTPMRARPGPSTGHYGSTTTDGLTGTMLAPAESRTVGWTDCGCDNGWTPGTVADPFAGAGTTALMARRLGRRALLTELSPAYCQLAAARLRQDVIDFDACEGLA